MTKEVRMRNSCLVPSVAKHGNGECKDDEEHEEDHVYTGEYLSEDGAIVV